MDAIVIVIVIVSAAVMVLVAMSVIAELNRDYDKGWRDHEELMKLYDMSPDDDALLKEMKQAVKLYIRDQKLYQSGDVKLLESATNWKEFKDSAWEVTVLRREK